MHPGNPSRRSLLASLGALCALVFCAPARRPSPPPAPVAPQRTSTWYDASADGGTGRLTTRVYDAFGRLVGMRDHPDGTA